MKAKDLLLKLTYLVLTSEEDENGFGRIEWIGTEKQWKKTMK